MTMDPADGAPASQPPSGGRLGELLGDLAVVVVGVLIALGVNAWYDGVQDRRSEREVLESLLVDLQRASATLSDMISSDQDIEFLAEAYPSRDSGAAPDSVYVIISGLFGNRPRPLHLRTYDELLGSGRLNLISDREIRLSLAEFDVNANSLEGHWEMMSEQWTVGARPILYGSLRWGGLAGRGGSPGFRGIPRVDVSRDTDLLENEALRNAVLSRRGFARIHRLRARSLTETVDSLTERVSRALAR